MNTLIIGGAGYLGSTLFNRLRFKPKGADSRYHDGLIGIVDNLMYSQGPLVFPHWPRYQSFWNCDIDDIPDKVITSFDTFFILSAYVGAPICDKYPKDAWRVNTESIYRLIKKLSPNQRVIYPCTNSGYGVQNDICTEETPMKSISLYGKSKEEAERIVMEHPKATSFRLATLYGVSWRHRIDLMVNYFTYLATCYGEISLFEGDFLRNFVHVGDVARIFTDCIYDEKTYGQIYNLGRDEDNTTKLGVVERIKDILPNTKVSYMSKEDPDKRNYNVSSAKLKKDTNLSAHIEMSNGISELISYYKTFPVINTKAHDDFLQYIKNA